MRSLSARRRLLLEALDLPDRFARSHFWISCRKGHGSDLTQAGLMSVWIATDFYDSSKGTSFRDYCAPGVYREMLREAKRLRSIVRRDSLGGRGWRKDVAPDCEIQGDNFAAVPVAPVDPDTTTWLLRHLGEFEREIVARWALGEETNAEIAADHGVSKQAIDQRRRPSLERLRMVLESEAA